MTTMASIKRALELSLAIDDDTKTSKTLLRNAVRSLESGSPRMAIDYAERAIILLKNIVNAKALHEMERTP